VCVCVCIRNVVLVAVSAIYVCIYKYIHTHIYMGACDFLHCPRHVTFFFWHPPFSRLSRVWVCASVCLSVCVRVCSMYFDFDDLEFVVVLVFIYLLKKKNFVCAACTLTSGIWSLLWCKADAGSRSKRDLQRDLLQGKRDLQRGLL
jgi:hypothetical protein